MKDATITVTAAPGKVVPIHHSDATAPGARLLLLREGEQIEVRSSPGIRRRIRSGDLVVVKPRMASGTEPPAYPPKLPAAPRVKPPAFDHSDEEK